MASPIGEDHLFFKFMEGSLEIYGIELRVSLILDVKLIYVVRFMRVSCSLPVGENCKQTSSNFYITCYLPEDIIMILPRLTNVPFQI